MQNNNKQQNEEYNISFFKKIIYSICKFEKYPEMAALGVKKALIYLAEIIIIFSVFYTIIFIKYINNNTTEKNVSLSKQMVTIIEKERNLNEQERQKFDYIINRNEVSDVSIIGSIYIVVVVSFFLATLIDIIMLSGFGLITCFIARIKINYKAIFNMSIYALTLPIFFKIVYYAITMLTNIRIKYFSTMYIAISYISLAAAIFLIKSNIIKQHLELMKIIEEGKEKIEESMQNLNKPKDDQKEDSNKKENDEKNKEKEDNKDTGSEEQGSNA